MNVTAIIVTHNSARVIGDCLRSLPMDAPITVVDNASTDDTLDCIHALRPDAAVHALHYNIGFGRANNLALEHVKTEYALLLNPDARLEGEALAQLCAALDAHPEAAASGPDLSTGSHTPDERRCREDPGTHDGIPDNPSGFRDMWSVPFLSGAAVLLRVEAVRGIGGFDPRIFLYFEDDDLCRRLRRAGHTLLSVSGARVVHLNRSSSPDTPRIIFRRGFHYGWSRIYMSRKYGGAWRGACTALAAMPYFLLRALAFGVTLQFRRALLDAAKLGGVLSNLGGLRA
ncbi:MAG: glycosyltransferase family 2 protein [Alphaproteobacteria bacterium]|nr:glycosyltransferase family 2 protein [Alphaproteobacteria bacterium]